MARVQCKAVYRLHTVVAGHCITDIKQKWENSISGEEKWPKNRALRHRTYLFTYLLTYLYVMIQSARSSGLSEQSICNQLGKTESMTKPCP